ncbi:alpha-2-macroglobulin [Subsaximicrobium wynnwilliamsii]|uniref:Alpha-2-macroglobulin n=2 Tax=Subsaximicrobium wynnwilliamsii TaxID=291179 RepID=A0A5C6ZI20_9FLAO|nr:alpha-2-macroglobulin [Subsaximicrobium wynnwilliamsii]TXD88582.1 alpha-2-macroglobulin [Subsaximicrobium wynnwilliamsii]TXE02519.1 alpha-2-macroglobulin [Subsaximicrobium wynnwilliamsii]
MILCFANASQAQNPDYNKLWAQVLKQENEGLPKSALKIVEQIGIQAKQDDNAPQQIRVMLYKSKYALDLEEDAQLKIIQKFKAEMSTAEAPVKNVLENMLANLYWQYFQQNRYQFYNRSKTETKVDAEDFRTWDLQTLFDDIQLHFENSLKNPKILQQTPIEDFSAILTEQKGSKTYRPTLYDLLSQNALTFYTTTENSISKPAYKFEIDNPDYLKDASTFLQLKITSKDSSSLELNALKIYQDLMQFHQADASPYAFADVDIDRLNFVKSNAIFNEKDSILLNTLQKESDKWNAAKVDVAARYDFEIAKLYYQQGQEYNPTTKPEMRWKLKEAVELCNKVIKNYPNSTGAKMCQNLKAAILTQTIGFTSEKVLPSQSFSRFLVNYSNFNSVDFKAYKVDVTEISSFNQFYNSEDQLKFLKNKAVSTQWTASLKDENDYQSHSTEVEVPKLENGHYIILAKAAGTNGVFATQTLQVSDFAVIDMSSDSQMIFQIINRNNGEPQRNVSVALRFQNGYNGNFSTNKLSSDAEGFISINKSQERYMNLSLALSKNDQTGYFDGFYAYNYGRTSENKNQTSYKSFLFTDRSIYRPGQTVYFKGIAMKTERGKSSVLADEDVYVTLYNTNDEDIKELEFKTNAFGSISGEFILPNGGLNGNYYLEFDSNSGNADMFSEHYFSVEEYKRPKFETSFKPVTETFKVNDSVTLNGTALAYAGSNITDAKVVYRVTRKVQYPRWYYWYRPWFNSEPQEITHGETSTNAKGEFEISFKAQPDESVDKETLPIFNYEITADVTDLNGETRSATTIVNVGYHALVASITVAEQLDKAKKDHKLSIDTKNLNGEFVAAEGSIKIYKLQAPERVLRQRAWEAPDYQLMSAEVFINKFPHEAYEDEANPAHWKKGKLVFESTFDTAKSKDIELGKIKNWESGLYSIELESTDKFGQLVKAEARTTVFSDDDKTVADNQLFTIKTNRDSYSEDENVELTLGSAAKDLRVTVRVEKDQKLFKTFIVPLSNTKKTIAIPVTKADLGGFIITYSLAAFNSFEGAKLRINVPYPKTDLEIETITFRDKLQPGTDETWSFKIKGPKGDEVSAEVLASMYDASLDQFKPHDWSFSPIYKPQYNSGFELNARQSFGVDPFRVYNQSRNYPYYSHQSYDQLNWFGFYFGQGRNYMTRALGGRVAGVQMVADETEIEETSMLESNANLDEVVVVGYGTVEKKINAPDPKEESQNFDNIQIRKNLQETAFFFPQLQTDAEGNVSFSFSTPEALTKWKLQLLAHNKTLESTVSSMETVTQKELMVIPNAPRFLRQGDEISISTKIANLTENVLSGQAKLILTDAVSGRDITSKLLSQGNGSLLGETSTGQTEPFTVDAKGNTQVSWNLSIPNDVDAVQYKILAKAGDFSDGEQNAMPVLSNRMLVTETLPMWIRSNETRTFTLDKLKNNSSTTLKNHKLTLEMTSNPAWYAVQALPYLMEYPYDCNEQTFSRYYANALASHIANSNPRIREVFNQWASQDALISNLEKNQELKNMLIAETPWLRDAESETEQKKRIALLFDMNKMHNELTSAKRKLQNSQMNNGAWAWFNGGEPNRYITQHIITGFGHLDKLGVTSIAPDDQNAMIEKAIAYLDAEFVQEYKDIKKYDKDADLNKDHLSYTQLHYLYMRSFFPKQEKSKEVQTTIGYYQTQIRKYWLKRSLYAKGLMALAMQRMDDPNTAKKILASLKENSITSDELGMYWKSNTSSWHWYQAPIETQALMIEAFYAIEKDPKTIDNLKIWLLKNKQTNSWKSTKATTEAVYALLLQGSDWLSVTDMVDVVIGGQQIEPSKLEDVKVEAGTGYYKTSWSASEITPEMATVKLTKTGDGIAWGSLYWQYFEDLDKITSAETPLKLKKQLFKKTNTATGEEISAITAETDLNVGDLIRVRIELRSDRAMEFIHMKDMRAAGLEPVNVLSKYKYQDGLGYYESTKDASTNFFFDYLPKGVYVFEYDLRVNNAGNMSNGITTIQSMYAPEFSSHSEGVRIDVGM